jgi:hypothetical protein
MKGRIRDLHQPHRCQIESSLTPRREPIGGTGACHQDLVAMQKIDEIIKEALTEKGKITPQVIQSVLKVQLGIGHVSEDCDWHKG